MTFLIANDIPFTEPNTDPVTALEDAIAFSADDWAETRSMAWVYGIVLGWDFDDDEDGQECRDEFRRKFGWTDDQMARLDTLHAAFEALK